MFVAAFRCVEECPKLKRPLPVRAAHHTRITLDRAAPPTSELIVRHIRSDQLLAEERRPIEGGARSLDVKTHPDALHVECSLMVGGRTTDNVSFAVDCGSPIDPVGQYFIVIGAMKAGTTSLYELLAQHPAICRTSACVPGKSFPKEINYFRKLYRKAHTPLHYDWRFPFDTSRHAWTLDVSPLYAMWPGSKSVPARIRSLGGKIKLAYIMRDPVDRIESHLAHSLRTGEASTMRHCKRTSRYAMQLDRYMEYFARGDILLLDFEQLRLDPAGIMSRICAFLELESFPCRSRIHNRRSIDFHLGMEKRADLVKALRPDVRRLINLYGFRPAEAWLQDKDHRPEGT